MKITHAIFDMDGTLTDSNGVWADAVYNYIDNHCKYKREDIPEIFFSEVILGGTYEALAYLRDTMGDDTDFDTIINIIMSHVTESYKKKQQLKKGAEEFLKKLKAQGADICVVTATPSDLATHALDLCGLSEYIDFLISSEDRKTGKESPYIFLEAAARMNCDIKDCTLFEDAIYSLRTGKALGMTLVGIEDYYCKPDTRTEIKEMCDFYTDDYSSIPLDS